MNTKVTPKADMPSLGGPGGHPAETDQIDIEQASARAKPPLPPELVVTGAFGSFVVGEIITDQTAILNILESHEAYVVPRYPQGQKSDTQA